MLILCRNEAEVLTNKEIKTLKKICEGCKKILQDEKLSNDFWTRLGNEANYQEIEKFIEKIEKL